jgi:hypothetical protein
MFFLGFVILNELYNTFSLLMNNEIDNDEKMNIFPSTDDISYVTADSNHAYRL